MGQSETEVELLLFRFHEATVLIDRYYTPLLCLLGSIGNSLSLLVFCMDSQYRSQSASYYLSALALSDTGYLLNLFAVWLESVRELVITSDITCPLVMYLGQVTCFLSIYLIVAFSVERYVAVHYPLARVQICTKSKARKIIAGLTVVALILFSYAWVIAKVVELKNFPLLYQDEEEGSGHLSTIDNNESITEQMDVVYRCTVPEEYYHISGIANYLDTCITLIVPFLLITFFNGRIAWSLWKLKDIRREMVATTRNNTSSPTSTPSSGVSVDNAHSTSCCRSSCRLFTCFGGSLRREKRTAIATAIAGETGEGIELTEVTAIAMGATTTNAKIVDKASDQVGFDENTEEIFPEGGNPGTGSVNKIQVLITQPCHHRHQQEQQHILTLSSVSEVRVTKTLLLVSCVFLLLNLPLHAIRCAQFIQTLTGEWLEEDAAATPDLKELFLPTAQLWANMLFNTNFAVNFLLYCANGRNFRKSLRKILVNRILRRNQTIQTSTSTYYNTNNARHQYVRRATATQEE